MKLRSHVILLVVLMTLALVLTGCIGGPPGEKKDQTVQEFLTEMSAALESMQETRIVELFDLPIVLLEGDPAEGIPQIELTKQHLITILKEPLQLARTGGARLMYETRDPAGGEMEIVFSDNNKTARVHGEAYLQLEINEATAEKAYKAYLTAITGWFFEQAGEALDELEIDAEMIEELVDESWDYLLEDVYAANGGSWPGTFEMAQEGYLVLRKVHGKWKISDDEPMWLPMPLGF